MGLEVAQGDSGNSSTASEGQVTSEAGQVAESTGAATEGAGETDTGTATAGEGGDTGTGEADPAAAVFTPNLKYKVMDQEKEIPAYLKDVIKDADTEAKVRELFEKADGLDIIKPKNAELKKELGETRQHLAGYEGAYQNLAKAYQRGDLDTFFHLMKVDEEKVLQWVADKVRLSQLPPEQQDLYLKRHQAQKQAWENEDSRLQSESSYGEQLSTVTGELLELALEKDEVKRFATAFDGKAGNAQAFRNAVIDVGEAALARGKNLTPMQAIKQVMDHYGKFITSDTASTSTGATPPSGNGQTKPKAEPPVIPNVTGRTSSPTAPLVKSIDDIKKARDRMLKQAD